MKNPGRPVSIPTGGPVFPIVFQESGGNDAHVESLGIRLRQWYAGMALAGLAAAPTMASDPKHVAEDAFALADAMIAHELGGS